MMPTGCHGNNYLRNGTCIVVTRILNKEIKNISLFWRGVTTGA